MDSCLLSLDQHDSDMMVACIISQLAMTVKFSSTQHMLHVTPHLLLLLWLYSLIRLVITNKNKLNIDEVW